MTLGQNSKLETVSGLYDAWARDDAESAAAAFDEGVFWFPAEGHPYSPDGKPWIGLHDLTENFFQRVPDDWEKFVTRPDRFYASGDTVIVEGRYRGIFKPTGRPYDAQFCHVWSLNDAARIVLFRQYADTAQMQRVMKMPNDNRKRLTPAQQGMR